jgi:hypothetical protein
VGIAVSAGHQQDGNSIPQGHEAGAGAIGYCDVSYASNEVARRSTTGFVFLLAGGAIRWQTRLQPTIAMSTTEAEYMAAGAATKEALWLRKLQHDLNLFPGPSCIKMFGDNQGALALIKNPVHHARSKHIDVLHHAIRERVSRKEVKFEFCPTQDMISDLFTKPLNRVQFMKLRACLGLVEVL